MHEQQAQTVSPCLWFCIITVTRTETVYEVGSNWSRPGFEDLQDCAPKTFCSSLKLLFPWSCHSLELLIWGKSTSSCLLDDNTQTSISSKEWKVRGTFIPWIFRFAPRSKVCWCFLGRQLNGSVKEPNKFHNYETEKITPKARDTAEYIELFGSSIQDRHAWHISCYSLNVRRYMSRYAWRSRVEKLNNSI